MFRCLIQKSGYIPNKLKASKKEKGRLSSPQQAMGFSPQVYNGPSSVMIFCIINTSNKIIKLSLEVV